MPDADATAEAEAQFFCPAYDRRFVGRTCADRWCRANQDHDQAPLDLAGSNMQRAEAATEAPDADDLDVPPRLFWCRDCPAGRDRAEVLLGIGEVRDGAVPKNNGSEKPMGREAAARVVRLSVPEKTAAVARVDARRASHAVVRTGVTPCARCGKRRDAVSVDYFNTPLGAYCAMCRGNAGVKVRDALRKAGAPLRDPTEAELLAKLAEPYQGPGKGFARPTKATPATRETTTATAADALVDPPQPAKHAPIGAAVIGHVQGPALATDPSPPGQDAKSGETSAHLGPATPPTTTAPTAATTTPSVAPTIADVLADLRERERRHREAADRYVAAAVQLAAAAVALSAVLDGLPDLPE